MRLERPRQMIFACRRDVPMRFGRPKLAWRGIAIVTFVMLLPVAGCETGEGSDKRSHHDVDHTTPDHWPDSPADLAGKITRRVETLRDRSEGPETAGRELSDLVSWTPEVAADSDLTESEWIPIYREAEALSRQLNSDREKWTEANLERASGLAEQIADASSRIVAVDSALEGNLGDGNLGDGNLGDGNLGDGNLGDGTSPTTGFEIESERAGAPGDQAGEGVSEIGLAGEENDG